MEQNPSSCSIGIWNYHLAPSKFFFELLEFTLYKDFSNEIVILVFKTNNKTICIKIDNLITDYLSILKNI